MSATLFVGGLAFTTTERDLHQYFSRYGEIEKINIIKDRITKASKGYGFVFFYDEMSVDIIVEENPHRIRGRQVDCQNAKKKSEKKQYKDMIAKTRIFVTCLTPNINNKDMFNFFGQYGPVKSAYVIRDPDTEKSLCYGFVIFENPKDANKIIRKPNLYLKGANINCDTYKEHETDEKCFDPVGKRKKKLNKMENKGNHSQQIQGHQKKNYNQIKKKNKNFYSSKNYLPVPITKFVPKNNDQPKMPEIFEEKNIIKTDGYSNEIFKREEENKEKKNLVQLFTTNEKLLSQEEKELKREEFKKLDKRVFQYSHVVGGNIRLNWSSSEITKERLSKKEAKREKKLFDILKVYVQGSERENNVDF